MNRLYNLKKALSRFIRGYFFPFFILFLLTLFLRCFVSEFGDDLYFRDLLADTSTPLRTLVQVLCTRYRTWSSRLLIEGVLIIIVHFINLWKIIDALITAGIAFLLSELLNSKRNKTVAWGICACISMLPAEIFCSAGWIATTLNYTWPLFFTLLALLPARRLLSAQKPSRFLYILSVPSLFFAASHEQFCCALLIFLTLFLFIYFRNNHRLSSFILIQLLLSLGNLIVIMLCPGNKNRFVREVANWFPGFDQFSIFQKVELGFSSTGYDLTMDVNFLYTFFTLLLCICVFLRHKSKIKRIISSLPFVISLCFGYLRRPLHFIFPSFTHIRDSFSHTGTGFSFSSFESMIPDLFLLIVFSCVLYGLYLALENHAKWGMAVVILLVGLGSRVMIGFSPTIWVSKGRACLLMLASFSAVSILLLDEITGVSRPCMNKMLKRGCIALVFSFTALHLAMGIF